MHSEGEMWQSSAGDGGDVDGGDCADLLCGEDAATAFVDSVSVDIAGDMDEDAVSAIAELIGTESELPPRPAQSDHVDAAARTAAVCWILEVRRCYGFTPQTAYLAVTYMDRFLSLHSLPQANGWAMQLVAVTCLSLASKMEETFVPSLFDLQIAGARYIFEPRTILRMELLVLAALHWRLRPVTPFLFIEFFASKIEPSREKARRVVNRATQIILSQTHSAEFFDHSPSSMAAAAVLSAAGATPALVAGWCIGLTEDGIISCYQQMQQQLKSEASSSSASSSQPKKRKRDLLMQQYCTTSKRRQ